MSFQAEHATATEAQTQDALTFSIVLSSITLMSATVASCLILRKLHFWGWSLSTRSRDGMDLRLIWPQLFVAVATTVYSLVNLTVFSLDHSSSLPVSGCGGLAKSMATIFVLAKIGIFFFLVRKAQVVDCIGNAHRFAFYTLYVFIFFYSIASFGAAIFLNTLPLVNDQEISHCSFEVAITWIGNASVWEVFITIGSFFVFLKPLISLSSNASFGGTTEEESRRKEALKVLIISNLSYGMGCLLSSFGLECYIVYVLGHEMPTSELLKAAGVMQVDLLIGLATMMISTRALWFETSQPSNHSRPKQLNESQRSDKSKRASIGVTPVSVPANPSHNSSQVEDV
jgi:hypothetical protein